MKKNSTTLLKSWKELLLRSLNILFQFIEKKVETRESWIDNQFKKAAAKKLVWNKYIIVVAILKSDKSMKNSVNWLLMLLRTRTIGHGRQNNFENFKWK